MRQEAAEYFRTSADGLRLHHAVEMRYRGQEHAVSVPCRPDSWDAASLLDAFHAEHEQAYTFRLDATPAEIVSFHLNAELIMTRPTLVAPEVPVGSRAAAHGTRSVDFGAEGLHPSALYRRERLAPGFRAAGPALVEEASSTTVVLPGQQVSLDSRGLLLVEEPRT